MRKVEIQGPWERRSNKKKEGKKMKDRGEDIEKAKKTERKKLKDIKGNKANRQRH